MRRRVFLYYFHTQVALRVYQLPPLTQPPSSRRKAVYTVAFYYNTVGRGLAPAAGIACFVIRPNIRSFRRVEDSPLRRVCYHQPWSFCRGDYQSPVKRSTCLYGRLSVTRYRLAIAKTGGKTPPLRIKKMLYSVQINKNDRYAPCRFTFYSSFSISFTIYSIAPSLLGTVTRCATAFSASIALPTA